MSVDIGVLAVQGDVYENIQSITQALDELGIKGRAISVKMPYEISRLDGLIIPGGESTTIGQISSVNGLLKAIKEKISDGMPVLGICAGLILLSNSVNDRTVGKTKQPLLEALDVTLERNSFGRQTESFEADVSMDSIGIPKFNGVFIRAPSISTAGPDIQVLSRLGNSTVAVKKGNIIGTAFHPELTGDLSLHKYFVSLVSESL